MIVRGSSWSDVLGRSMPKAPRSAFKPAAMPIPATIPTTAANEPDQEGLDHHETS